MGLWGFKHQNMETSGKHTHTYQKHQTHSKTNCKIDVVKKTENNWVLSGKIRYNVDMLNDADYMDVTNNVDYVYIYIYTHTHIQSCTHVWFSSTNI